MQVSSESDHRADAPQGTLVSIVRRIYRSWATRSLAVGPIATVFDLAMLLLCVKVLHTSTRIGAMLGVLTGSIFTFLANRYFAFRDHNPQLAPQAVKFVLTTIALMLVHGQLVVILRDYWGVPIVISKILADLLVFSVGQLLLLRYLVFPKRKGARA